MTAKVRECFSASILSANFARLGEEVSAVLAAGVDEIHCDVMDHHFVPNLSFGAVVCEALRKEGINAPIDVHLMVTDPDAYILPFAKAGATRLTFHASAVVSPQQLIDRIHQAGMQAGIAFNPDKPLALSETLLASIDLVLLMSVYAGFGGQTFLPESIDKIREARALIAQYNPAVLLSVDGGIKLDNIAEVVAAGANHLVMGSALFGATDYAARVAALRQTIAH